MPNEFPSTRRSAVFRTRSLDPEERSRAFGTIVALYWKPVYKYLRLRWSLAPEDAEDITQAFFTRALEKEFFARYEPERAKFRTFLRTCLDGFAANARRDARRQKRGGGAAPLPLEFETAEGELQSVEIPVDVDPDVVFQREWVRSVFARAVEALQAHCQASGKEICFALFERYDLHGAEAVEERRLTYADLAAEFALPATQVTNHLAWARREFRRLTLETLREVCASDEEFRAEARAVLGVEP